MPGRKHQFIQNYLYDKLMVSGINTVMEYTEGDRRADLYLLRPKINLEIQTSPISIKEIKSRNKDWEEVGVSTIWVFAGRKWIRYIDELMYLNKTLRKLGEFYIFERRELFKVTPLKYVRTKTVDKSDWVLEMPLFEFDKEKIGIDKLVSMGVVV